MTDIVLIGVEETRGTAVAGALTLAFARDGVDFRHTQHTARSQGSSTFPLKGKPVALGLTPTIRMTPEINVETVRDIIEMATIRADGILSSFTILQAKPAQKKISGCVVSSLELSFSRSAAPGDDAILVASMELAGMLEAAATGITAGTLGAGNPFVISKSTFTINSVEATKVLSFRHRITNAIAPTVHKSDLSVEGLVDGECEHETTLTALFDADAWRALCAAGTAHDASLVLATGTANETVTLDYEDAILGAHTPSGSDVVVQEVTIVGDGPAISFGASIGAGVLSLG
jgi:hypothetical protein